MGSHIFSNIETIDNELQESTNDSLKSYQVFDYNVIKVMICFEYISNCFIICRKWKGMSLSWTSPMAERQRLSGEGSQTASVFLQSVLLVGLPTAHRNAQHMDARIGLSPVLSSGHLCLVLFTIFKHFNYGQNGFRLFLCRRYHLLRSVHMLSYAELSLPSGRKTLL